MMSQVNTLDTKQVATQTVLSHHVAMGTNWFGIKVSDRPSTVTLQTGAVLVTPRHDFYQGWIIGKN